MMCVVMGFAAGMQVLMDVSMVGVVVAMGVRVSVAMHGAVSVYMFMGVIVWMIMAVAMIMVGVMTLDPGFAFAAAAYRAHVRLSENYSTSMSLTRISVPPVAWTW
ncbi:hypothetical protein Taqua_01495 [Tepidimonas aquatica]|uniref:Uncharacterized protein n=1 Tax=Tepidimonas aquatica TaxID=247482 RepID=A0A554WLY2_9BURK|nr:hypothetical protein Taqua_01495 [Tepidimonas aquatica]